MPTIKINDLSFQYVSKKNTTTVFSHLNLELENEKVIGILGESGCGKTTLFRLITGLEDPNEGEIYFDDKKMNDVDSFKRKISLLSQNISLYPFYSVFKNIAFPLLLKKTPTYEIREKVRQMARLFDIESCLTRKPKHISLGQQQLANIAKCLLNDSELYIFDEPFSHLDVDSKRKAKDAIKKYIKDNKKNLIIASHDISDIYSFSDEIIIMKEGTIIFKDDSDKLRESDDPYIKLLLGWKNE